MSIKYPESWNKLLFPAKRQELIEYLRLLAGGAEEKAEDSFDIDLIYHFIFDDTDLGDQSVDEIGEILLDEHEVTLIHRLAALLDSILVDIGDEESVTFARHKSWPDIQSAARLALEEIRTRGLPTLS